MPRQRNLDTATQLVCGTARLKLFPEALEGSLTRVLPGSRRSRAEPNPLRNERDGSRRAATAFRRYSVHNRLRGMATLTSSGTDLRDYAAFRAAMARLLRAVRARHGTPLPYAFVVEPHALAGHHGHLLLPERLLGVVEATWRHGSTDTCNLDTVEDIRAASTYLAKVFDTHHESHRQRYAAGQGFRPTPITYAAPDFAAAARVAELLMGRPADRATSPYLEIPAQPVLLEWSDRSEVP